MKIELKNVKFYERMSEETNAFVADIFVDGKKVGYAKNDGHGGCTDIRQIGGVNGELFVKCVEYCKNLPDHTWEWDGVKHSMKNNIEIVVDDLFEKWLDEKEQKKLMKLCEKNIVYENGFGIYEMYGWKNVTINQMLQNPVGLQRVKKVVEDLKKEGKKIINTNLQLLEV